MRDLFPWVDEALNKKRVGRKVKQKVANRIGEFLLERGSLLVDENDPSNPSPYLIADDKSVIPINENDSRLRLVLQDCGLNPSEQNYRFTVEALQHTAVRKGRSVTLERYSVFRNETLYISSGPAQMIAARMKEGKPFLQARPNGFEGILFPSDACFPKWRIASGVRLDALSAFRPRLTAPPEAPDYTASVQMQLFRVWLICLLLRFTLPILSNIGSKGSGKSILMRALVKLFLGVGGDVSSHPKNQGDFYAAATSLPVYGIENLDSQTDKWFPDAIAGATTGVSQTSRRLYSDSSLFNKLVTARFAITTRTAAFASRPDVTERVLPLFYGSLAEAEKRDDIEMLDEVVKNRDGVMTLLTLEAIRLLAVKKEASGLPSRFQGFAQMVVAADPTNGRAALLAWERAQLFGLVEMDPFTAAIIEHVHASGMLKGYPSEILKALPNFNPQYHHGGKAIANKLREMKQTLALAGIKMLEEQSQGKTCFTFIKEAQPA